MEVKDYIIKKINELRSILKDCNFSVRYAYEESTDFHVIEISPECIRRGNESYMRWETSVWKEFNELFPISNLVISEPDGLNDMSNMLYSYSASDSIAFKLHRVKTKRFFNSDLDSDIIYNKDYTLAA